MFLNIKLPSVRNQRILVDDRRLFLFTAREQPCVVDDTCPHRGGPLSFGEIDEEAQTLKCKWHDMRHGLCRLKDKAAPSILNNGTLTIYLPGERRPGAPDVICLPA